MLVSESDYNILSIEHLGIQNNRGPFFELMCPCLFSCVFSVTNMGHPNASNPLVHMFADSIIASSYPEPLDVSFTQHESPPQ